MSAQPTCETKPMVCPFCGQDPDVYPDDPEIEGNAWGQVSCNNPVCAAQPSVKDGEECSDERGSDAYKQAAIRRWNYRLGQLQTDIGARKES